MTPTNLCTDYATYAGTDGASVSESERPQMPRRDTEIILSYYQSSQAGRSYDNVDMASNMDEQRSSSAASSASHYSSGPIEAADGPLEKQSREEDNLYDREIRRRQSVRSVGGSDKRRLAIVEMDPPLPLQPPSSSDDSQRSLRRSGSKISNSSGVPSLSARRGANSSRVGGLAFVAPPDASPRTYIDLSPPVSAPLLADTSNRGGTRADSEDSSQISHQRSASEAVHSTNTHRKNSSSRDVGIIGMTAAPLTPHSAGSTGSHQPYVAGSIPGMESQTPQSPIFQIPRPESSSSHGSPSHSTVDIPTLEQTTHGTPYINTGFPLGQPEIVTPEIGQSKSVHDRVAGPVVIDIPPSNMWPRDGGSPTKYFTDSDSFNLSPTSSAPSSSHFSPLSPQSYLLYQAGVHATAGPLPSPPRHIFGVPGSPAPPRPPRLHSPPPMSNAKRGDVRAAQQALQLTESNSHLSTKLSSSSLKRENSDFSITAVSMNSDDAAGKLDYLSALASDHNRQASRSNHTREGAFPASSIFLHQSPRSENSRSGIPLSPTQFQESDQPTMATSVSSEMSLPVVKEPPNTEHDHSLSPTRSGFELKRESSWVSLRNDFARGATPSSDDGARASLDACSSQHSFQSGFPSPSKVSVSDGPRLSSAGKPLKSSLSNLKRFSSLPRVPSLMASGSPKTRSRSRDRSWDRSRDPSPSAPPLPRIRERIRSPWPEAMQCMEVRSKKSALERALFYAQKINELAMYDCGLGDWVVTMKFRSLQSRDPSTLLTMSTGTFIPATPATRGPQRHVSRGSMASEATFPRRADAYVATDLTYHANDDIADAPPPLPYPSLARPPRVSSRTFTIGSPPSSVRTMPSPSSSKSTGSGFFASIGRKASIKKDRSGLTHAPPSGKRLSRMPISAPQPQQPPPRSVQIVNSPSVPGGPRALPGRAQRTRSTIAPKSEPSVSPDDSDCHSRLGRQPSVPNLSRPRAVDLEFDRQVDKLADLLPQADREVLAGYLHRCGQDIVAIGQYLEDEKNGTLATA